LVGLLEVMHCLDFEPDNTTTIWNTT
jgi:hypothetical protein